MNAGFTNLYLLKRALINENLATTTTYDPAITALGLGVAQLFATICNRKFDRATGATEIHPADRAHFLLTRFPVESVSAIDVKITETEGWTSKVINEFVRTIDLANGIVMLPGQSDAGPYYGQVRFTYTGGFFWNQLEPTDGGYPTSQPSGSTALPADIKNAWLLQCEYIWKNRDKLGISIGEENSDAAALDLGAVTLAPLVKATLDKYTRLNLV